MRYLGNNINNICDFIRDTRESTSMTRKELHDKSGISIGMLFYMDTGVTKSPTVATVEDILDVLGYELVIQKKKTVKGMY